MGQTTSTTTTNSATTSSSSVTSLGIKIVMISDTHGHHRDVNIPDGDVLIHGGDWTQHGKLEDALDFNTWLGEIKSKFQHIIVVNGNHESNATWKHETHSILSNAIFLKNETTRIDVVVKKAGGTTITEESTTNVHTVTVHGTEFYWSMRYDDEPRPEYDAIPNNTQILIAHNPPKGVCDGKTPTGCPALRRRLDELSNVGSTSLRLLVCGHIHKAHGTDVVNGVTIVNAANADKGHGDMGHPATVFEL